MKKQLIFQNKANADSQCGLNHFLLHFVLQLAGN